jgi:hypothetical protein
MRPLYKMRGNGILESYEAKNPEFSIERSRGPVIIL